MEWLTVKNFFILQAILVIAGIIYLRRRPNSGVRLKFKRAQSSPISAGAETEEFSQAEVPFESSTESSGERHLNVHFNYNGHSWDAYEVLGIPAGSSAESVKKAYEAMISKMDPDSREIVELAYKAIRG